MHVSVLRESGEDLMTPALSVSVSIKGAPVSISGAPISVKGAHLSVHKRGSCKY